jgi:catechol 2,3-dioxygenase-like lactoylglutathione lyase family enzyme
MTSGHPMIEEGLAASESAAQNPAATPAASDLAPREVRLGERNASPVGARCMDHVNLSVRNLDISADFYARLLGLEIKEQGHNGGGRWCILGARDRFYVCFFEVPSGTFKPNDVHINHVGFVVDDMDETVRRIHALGLRLGFGDAPLEWPRSKSAYVTDPDGIVIEFTNRFGGGLD